MAKKIFFTKRIGYYLKSDGGFECWNSLEKCKTKKFFKFYSADGKYRYHCAFGAEADCKYCGCSQVPLIYALKDGDFETWSMACDYWDLPVINNFSFNSLLKLKLKKMQTKNDV